MAKWAAVSDRYKRELFVNVETVRAVEGDPDGEKVAKLTFMDGAELWVAHELADVMKRVREAK